MSPSIFEKESDGGLNKTEISVPRLLIVGTHEGAGTATVVLGILVCLKKAGVSVALGSFGSSLIKTTHHRRISTRLSHTLDPCLLNIEQVISGFAKLSSGAEIIIIEGAGGIFDLKNTSGLTQAKLAEVLGLPIVLVIDCEGFGESISAVVDGFMRYSAEAKIAAIVLNKVRDKVHGKQLTSAIEERCSIPILGCIPRTETLALLDTNRERVEHNPSLLARNDVLDAGKIVQGNIEFTFLKRISETAKPIKVLSELLSGSVGEIRIAVPDDAAFHLTIQDNLDLIRRNGAKLVAFSPLADRVLPVETAALYIPGGYVHLYATDLQANQSMFQAIRDFVDAGGVCYAEGNAIAYLCEKLVLSSGEVFSMAGIIPAVAQATVSEKKVMPLRYCKIKTFERSILGEAKATFHGLLDTRWLIRSEAKIPRAFEVTIQKSAYEEQSSDPLFDGFLPRPNVLISSIALHWGSERHIATNFVGAAKHYLNLVK